MYLLGFSPFLHRSTNLSFLGSKFNQELPFLDQMKVFCSVILCYESSFAAKIFKKSWCRRLPAQVLFWKAISEWVSEIPLSGSFLGRILEEISYLGPSLEPGCGGLDSTCSIYLQAFLQNLDLFINTIPDPLNA